MKVSIITVCYNSKNHIESTVRSVVGQNYQNIEYIIIDGGSTDGTLELLATYEENIAVLVSEKDDGMYNAINKGIALATGELIGLLHSDDVLENPDTISSIVEKCKTTEAEVIYGDLIYVDQKNINKMIRYWRSGKFSIPQLRLGWMPPHPTVYVRKSVIDQFGVYDTNFSIAADYDWMVRILKNNPPTAYVDEVCVRMRMGGASNKNLPNVLVKMKDDLRALRKNKFGAWHTLLFKNLRKIHQFFSKPLTPKHFTS